MYLYFFSSRSDYIAGNKEEPEPSDQTVLHRPPASALQIMRGTRLINLAIIDMEKTVASDNEFDTLTYTAFIKLNLKNHRCL